MTSKYAPFEYYLQGLPSDQGEIILSFEQIERILNDKLPTSAHKHPAWWANQKDGSHIHAHSWMDAGWKVDQINFEEKWVRFTRVSERFATETINKLDNSHKSLRGQLTAEIGRSLRFENFDTLYDHDISGEGIGRIASYIGDKNQRGTQLSYIDIAIVENITNKVIALIEIEETSNRPKTIIGDIFGFLLGDNVTFQGRNLEVGEETALIIVGFSKILQPGHKEHILQKVEQVRSVLGTGNSKIGKVIIESFADPKQLITLIKSLIPQ